MSYDKKSSYVWPVRDSQSFAISAVEYSTIITESQRLGFGVQLNMAPRLPHMFQEPNVALSCVTLIRNRMLGAILVYVGVMSNPMNPSEQILVYEAQLSHIARTSQIPNMLKSIGITNARIPWNRKCYLCNYSLTPQEFIVAANNYYEKHPEYRDLPADPNNMPALVYLLHRIPEGPEYDDLRAKINAFAQANPIESPLNHKQLMTRSVVEFDSCEPE